jgi:L-ribulose-5-phosphate 3-epimerase
MALQTSIHRRGFLQATAGLAAGTGLLNGAASVFGQTNAPVDHPIPSGKGRIYKSVKWGMIETDGSVLDKFRLQKELGYDGMELVSPSELEAGEVRRARRETGMPVHGLVDMKHWEIRLSSPDPAVRGQGVAILEQCLRDCSAFGGNSVLLVPGRVSGPDETHDDVSKRSIAEIRKVLPLASKLGVWILIENVWNGFCETPEQMRDYIDEIASPWVGAYFDIGNCRKFGRSEDWVRTLGRRIVKLDVKDWGDTEGFCKIGDGDVDWPAVRQALAEIKFTGWCTAEVSGGGREELADIARRMDQVLTL